MYRVVLIDDERIIVEGLRRVVKWAEYHCEVVGTAYDAASGAAMIRSTRPQERVSGYADRCADRLP